MRIDYAECHLGYRSFTLQGAILIPIFTSQLYTAMPCLPPLYNRNLANDPYTLSKLKVKARPMLILTSILKSGLLPGTSREGYYCYAPF